MKKLSKKQKNKKTARSKSIAQIKKEIPKYPRESFFSSFITFPKQIYFQTQDENEAVVLFLRQHPVVNLKWIITVLILIPIPLFFEFLPFYSTIGVQFQTTLTLSWYLILFGFTLAKTMNWFFNIFILTDERMIDIDFINIFYRIISDAKLENIQDVNSEMSGVWQTFFNYGSVFVQTAGETPQFTFQNIPNPDKVVKIINKLIDLEEQEKLEGRVR